MYALKSKKLFLLDLDGTLYLDGKLFDGTLPFLDAIRKRGGRYLFLTNNSSRGVDAYVEKLTAMGVPCTESDFLTSVDATAEYLSAHHREQLLYVLGTTSFKDQLSSMGFRVTDTLSDGIEALVMGFDTELTFSKLEDACKLLGRGVPYIATNPDLVCPTAYGYVPDCGSVATMLFNATGREPLYIGKPQPAMLRLAMDKTGYTAAQTVFVGDRIYTDIASGANAGVDTVLVLSGEGTVEEARALGITPTWVYGHVGVLADLLGS